MARELVPALVMATLLAACSEPPRSSAGSVTLPVVAGEPSDASQDGVLLLRGLVDDGTELICTASLVAPNLVLTARHCVAYLSEGLFSCTVRGELEPEDAVGGRLGLHLPAERIELYAGEVPRRAPVARGQAVLSTLSPTICTNDIAFVVLDRALELPLVPLRLEGAAKVGELSVLVGFGMDETESPIDYVRQPRRQRRDLSIAAVGPSSLSDGVTTVPPRTVLLRGPSGCIGDSGGPLLSQATGAVLAVYSLQQGASCTGANVGQQMVHVPAFGTLIAEAFEAAGAEPVPEAPLPTAEGGAAGAPNEPPVPSASGAGGAAEPEAESPGGHREASGCAMAPPPPGGASAMWLLVLPGLVRARRRRF